MIMTNKISSTRHSTKFINVVLNNLDLIVDKATTTYQITHKKNGAVAEKATEVKTEQIIYRLREVSVGDLYQYRRSNTPSFVLKVKGKYYYSKIDKRINLMPFKVLDAQHVCAVPNKECDRLSAAQDPKGCAKIRDVESWIENYDFIEKGFQVFNSSNDCFFVADCKNYKKPLPREIPDQKRIKELKLAIAQWVNPEIKDLRDRARFINANKSRNL